MKKKFRGPGNVVAVAACPESRLWPRMMDPRASKIDVTDVIKYGGGHHVWTKE